MAMVRGGHVMLRDQRSSGWPNLLLYLRRPQIYVNCALPLLAPSLMLIIVPALDSTCSKVYLVIGSVLLTLSVTCFSLALIFFILNRTQIQQRKKLLFLLQDKSQSAVLTLGSKSPSILVTPCTSLSSGGSSSNLTSLSSSSSLISSRRAGGRRSNKAIANARGGARVPASSSTGSLNNSSVAIGLRRKKKRSIIKLPVAKLPSLIEEEAQGKSLNRGNPHNVSRPETSHHPGHHPVGIGSPQGTDNIEQLKGYLNMIDQRRIRATGPNVAKSLDEKELNKRVADRIEQPGFFTDRPATRDELSNRKSLTPRPDVPVLIVSSHERSGLGTPSFR